MIHKFSLATQRVVDFSLPLLEWDLKNTPTCEGYKFEEGSARIDLPPFYFQESLRLSSRFMDTDKDRARAFLFSGGLGRMTVEKKRVALINERRLLVGPDFGWSLLKEGGFGGQKTLRYLHDTFGVQFIDFLGRIIIDPQGNRCALTLFREGTIHLKIDGVWTEIEGSWTWGICRLDCERGDDSPTLAFL